MAAEEIIAPTTLDEAETLRQELTLDVQEIQAQLGDRSRTDDEGGRLSSHDYWKWRKRAQHALNLKLEQLRVTKQWIREHRKTGDNWLSIHEAIDHVSNLFGLVINGHYPAEAQTKIDAAKDFLRRAKANSAQ